MAKPHMFIGSSVEGKEVAEAIQVNLDYDVYCTVWHQGVFGLSGGTLDTLVDNLKNFDFATLVLTADDLLTKRGQRFSAPRDNVLFELGLFMGYMGRGRTFVIHPRQKDLALPTDLAGITAATYDKSPRQTLQAALGAACTQIKNAIADSHPTRPSRGDSSIYAELRELRQMMTKLVNSLTTNTTSAYGDLKFLEGAWKNIESNSMAYAKFIEGAPRVAYCYEGNSEATAEYFDLRLIGDEIVGKFRWFNERGVLIPDFALLKGNILMKIIDKDKLEGGWWFEHDVPVQSAADPDKLRHTRGMQVSVWQRESTKKFPRWAEEYFQSRRWLDP
jgi:hypothetical protein